jgi:diguanylate cyclase
MVAKAYLIQYIDTLISINSMRVTSMAEIMKKNVILYYKEHLEWLSKVALAVQQGEKEDFPELNVHLCAFGKWLDTDEKDVIKNNSKYKAINKLHSDLHLFAEKIFSSVQIDEYHALLTYLEKCELISLNIGTELALIDNILMNKQVTKDSLTKALNRHVLEQLFKNQYEIALSTNNTFILAMCDLDYFKKINDSYGHLAGDKVLVE